MASWDSVNEVQAKILAQQAKQGQQIETIEATTAAIKTSLLGNGKPGIIVRLDRVEQRHRFVSRIVWLLVGVLIAAGANHIWGGF